MKKKKGNKEEKNAIVKENDSKIVNVEELNEKDVTINKDIRTRLRRIEGQVKGIEKMMEEEAKCKDVLIQIAAIRAAINKVGCLMLQNYTKDCMVDENNRISDEKLYELTSTLVMFLK